MAVACSLAAIATPVFASVGVRVTLEQRGGSISPSFLTILIVAVTGSVFVRRLVPAFVLIKDFFILTEISVPLSWVTVLPFSWNEKRAEFLSASFPFPVSVVIVSLPGVFESMVVLPSFLLTVTPFMSPKNFLLYSMTNLVVLKSSETLAVRLILKYFSLVLVSNSGDIVSVELLLARGRKETRPERARYPATNPAPRRTKIKIPPMIRITP